MSIKLHQRSKPKKKMKKLFKAGASDIQHAKNKSVLIVPNPANRHVNLRHLFQIHAIKNYIKKKKKKVKKEKRVRRYSSGKYQPLIRQFQPLFFVARR